MVQRIMNRSHDLADFGDSMIAVSWAEPIDDRGAEYCYNQIGTIDQWGEDNCRGKFLILTSHVLFTNERDALIFKLKFG